MKTMGLRPLLGPRAGGRSARLGVRRRAGRADTIRRIAASSGGRRRGLSTTARRRPRWWGKKQEADARFDDHVSAERRCTIRTSTRFTTTTRPTSGSPRAATRRPASAATLLRVRFTRRACAASPPRRTASRSASRSRRSACPSRTLEAHGRRRSRPSSASAAAGAPPRRRGGSVDRPRSIPQPGPHARLEPVVSLTDHLRAAATAADADGVPDRLRLEEALDPPRPWPFAVVEPALGIHGHVGLTRFTLSAASASTVCGSSASTIHASTPMTSRCFAKSASSLRVTGEDVDDTAGQIARGEALAPDDGGARIAGARERDDRVAPQMTGSTVETSPSSAGRSGATTPITPIGPTVLKSKCGPRPGCTTSSACGICPRSRRRRSRDRSRPRPPPPPPPWHAAAHDRTARARACATPSPRRGDRGSDHG